MEDDAYQPQDDKCGDFISIHVPRVEDDCKRYTLYKILSISIHVPRVEDDLT